MKNNSHEETITCLVVAILYPVLAIVLYLLNRWILSLLWKWFMVTTFGLNPLTIAQAVGVSIIVGFLTRESGDYKKEERVGLQIIIPIFGVFIAPFLTLLTGYIVYIILIV